MTMARRQLVNVSVTRYYHCISRCVRQASLCGKGFTHRKTWIEMRLQFLAEYFAISVCGFSVLDNHLHILCRLDPGVASTWSDEEVMRRWIAIYAPSGLNKKSSAFVNMWIDEQCKDARRVACFRERLQNLGWFMKALKEPLSRLANKEDDCKGTFWESRYKSIAILDEEALLATCAYIDLNPVAAGIASLPEKSPHTSIRQRVRHVHTITATKRLRNAIHAGSVATAVIEGDIEQSHWLCPLQDRRRLGEAREGIFSGFSLSAYLQLVDWTARLCRTGKARLSQDVRDIIERLGSSARSWHTQMQRLFHKERLIGHYCATRHERLRAVARQRGLHRVSNTVIAVG